MWGSAFGFGGCLTEPRKPARVREHRRHPEGVEANVARHCPVKRGRSHQERHRLGLGLHVEARERAGGACGDP